MNHSRKAIWQAVNSEYGDRLVEIAQEHSKLAWELVVGSVGRDPVTKAIYVERISQLRKERDSIIQRFEDAADAI